MNAHRRWISVLVAAQICVVGGSLPAAEPVRPNVVVFLSDDAGWGDFSRNGNTQLATPNIDSLAARGVTFERFFVCPLCAPTRAEFLTGRYYPRTGVYGVSTGQERMDLDEHTIADAFRAAGYATGAFGKWHNGSQWPYHPMARGFGEFYGYTSGHWGEYFDPPLEHNGRSVRGKGYIVDLCTDQALDFIQRNRDRPFFCYIPFTTPHSPWAVPDEDWQHFKDKPITQRATLPDREDVNETRCALAMLENQDRNVGRVLHKLDELQLTENTIVLYFSDNGPNSWRWNGDMKGVKGTIDEGGVRSTCFLRWPEKLAAGRRIQAIAGAIDLLPTLTALAGVARVGDKPLDGQDLSPLLMGADAAVSERMIFSTWGGKVSVRTQTHRLDGQGELFDMLADPGQTAPVTAHEKSLAERLATAAREWHAAVFAEDASSTADGPDRKSPGSALDPRPCPVGYREFPRTWLPARDGRPIGGVKRSAAAPNCSYFVNWARPDDALVWEIDVHTAGRYAVEILYTCPLADEGSAIEMSFGDSRLSGKVLPGWDPPLYTNQDTLPRPHGESAMKEFRPLELGTIDLEAGRGPLTLRAVDIPGREVMQVRAVVLTLCPGAEVITLREGWVVSSGGGSRGRISLPTDRLESAWLDGTLALPDRTKDESPSVEGLPAWKRVQADDQGAFSNFGPPNAWLTTFVESPAEQVWLLDAQGHNSVRVNDVPRCGDIYSNGTVELPVRLQSGTNTLIFAGSRGKIVAKLRRPEKDIYLSTRDTTFPHVVRGESEALWGALLLVNATDQVQAGLSLTAAGPGFQATETTLPPLSPLSVRKIGFRIQPDPAAPADAWKAKDVALDLKLARRSEDEQAQPTLIDHESVRWETRDAGQTHRRTFVSNIDGGVQYYGVVPPLENSADPNKRPGLVLSLHGAGVEAEGQANVYAAKPNLYVITPTNRRSFGFDWEDWGRSDALEVLHQASTRFQTDPRRTYLTGHSMGGHGTWHIGSLFPDRFAAIGPSAGWISFSTYAGGKPSEGDDPVSQMLRRGVAASDTFSRIQNLAYPGVYILHGDQDDNVPVEQARTMREQLAKFHPDFVYKEQPGAGHWWGNACCDWPAMFAFFADHELPPHENVGRINFATPGPAVAPRCFWATVAAQVHPGQLSRVDLQFNRETRTISGTTDNVYRLALQLTPLRATQAKGAELASLTVDLDGAKLADVPLDQQQVLWLERNDSAWRVIAEPSLADKGPHRSGPLKEAFQNRFLLVYGTEGNPEENAWMLGRARFDAETFGYRGNGSVDVIADTQWKTIAETDRNVIVYGNATINAGWRELLADCPVVAGRGQWQITNETPRAGSAALWMVRPRPGSLQALVAAIGGTDVNAMRATNRPSLFSSGTGYPDLIIAAPDYLQKGAQGVILAGYFGIDWSFEKGEWARQ